MSLPFIARPVCATLIVIHLTALCFVPAPAAEYAAGVEKAQVPTWSKRDLNLFLHGSMSTEVIPESVLRAFIRAYPDLFSSPDLSQFGLIPDPAFGWPVGFARARVPHLGGRPSVGINCASCHVGEVTPAGGGASVRVLGMTSQFDVEAFLGSLIVSTVRTAEPPNMRRFLTAYLAVNDPQSGEQGQKLFASEWQKQESKINAAMTAPGNLAAGLRAIHGSDLRLEARALARGEDLAALSRSMLDLFHNMRFALHVPDRPPPPAPPNGPGRNDPWRILSYSLLGVMTKPAPVKFGTVWNEDQRQWVHVDGNTRSPIVRNLAASLGLGAPLIAHHGELDFALVKRQTALSEVIRPPRYPWTIDRAASERGSQTYQTLCASCHSGAESDQRLHAIAEIQTDPNRAEIFTPEVADRFNKFFAQLQVTGYDPPVEPLRGTQKYWAFTLAGVWARSPYLHNGTVRTMQELLSPPTARAKTFHRGTRVYDTSQMGYADEGAYLLDTSKDGGSNGGHEYGTDLPAEQKRDLIEYLKTL